MAVKENSHNDLAVRLGAFEQQMGQIQQQQEIIERNILEMSSIMNGLDNIKETKDAEIFSPIGKGIFIKTKKVSNELLVDIGNGNFVKKSVEDTKKLIGEQIKKLQEIMEGLNKTLEKLNEELTDTFLRYQKDN